MNENLTATETFKILYTIRMRALHVMLIQGQPRFNAVLYAHSKVMLLVRHEFILHM